MTERLYYSDSPRLDFDAKIIATGRHQENHYTVLDRSAFYPTSGGQPHDTGVINDIEIVDVIESDSDEVWHISAKPIGADGQKVKGQVDKTRRLLRRQQHSAQHILSQAFVNLYGYETVSVHLGDEYGAVELDAKAVGPEQLEAAEKEANRIIAEALPIEIMMVDSDNLADIPLRKVPERTGKIRVIRIGEYDYSACGGTHCGSTAEVGMIKIIGLEKIRGQVLVNFLSGVQATDDYRLRFSVTDALAQKLTCHFSDLPDKFDKLAAENKGLRKQQAALQKTMLPIKAKELAESAQPVGKTRLLFQDIGDYDNKLAGQLAAEVAGMVGGVAVLFLSGRLVVATAADTTIDASSLVKRFGEVTGLKGGGSARQAQLGGALPEKLNEYRKEFERLLSDE